MNRHVLRGGEEDCKQVLTSLHRLNLCIFNSCFYIQSFKPVTPRDINYRFIPSGFHCCVKVSTKGNDRTEGFFLLCPCACMDGRTTFFPPQLLHKKSGVNYSLSQRTYKFFPLKQSFCGSIFLPFQLIGKTSVEGGSLLVCESTYIT